MAIELSVLLREDLDASEIEAGGFELQPYNAAVSKAFGVPYEITGKHSHQKLWDVIRNWWGRTPDEFVTADPVHDSRRPSVPKEWKPYEDGWGLENQVYVQRKAIGATLIETSGSTDAIATTSIENKGSKHQEGQETELSYSEDVEDTHYRETTVGSSLTLGYEITVGGEFAGAKAESKRSVEFTVEASHTKGASKSITKGKVVRLKAQVDAEPHSIYPVSIMLGRGKLKVAVECEYSLRGFARALYVQKPYARGQYESPPMDINGVLDAMGLPRTFCDTEIIDVGFVTSGRISIGERKSV